MIYFDLLVLAGWLAGWLDGELAGRLAGWLAVFRVTEMLLCY